MSELQWFWILSQMEEDAAQMSQHYVEPGVGASGDRQTSVVEIGATDDAQFTEFTKRHRTEAQRQAEARKQPLGQPAQG
jgi:hypothetical protein